MRKEAIQKCKGLKLKTSDEKRGNLKTEGAQLNDLQRKKGEAKNTRGLS
jgi:hypothetical protein